MDTYSKAALVISLIALTVAIRAEWRVSKLNPAIKFSAEAQPYKEANCWRIKITNTGYKPARYVRVNPSLLHGLKTRHLGEKGLLASGGSMWFLVYTTSFSPLPDQVEVLYRHSPHGRERVTVVPLSPSHTPDESDGQESTPSQEA